MTYLLLALGLSAGILTTIAGAGGGMLLVLSLSLVLGPKAALSTSVPALFVGNVHRAFSYRARIERRAAVPIVRGALPGSLLGGAFAVSVPSVALEVLLAVMTALLVLRAFRLFTWTPPASALTPSGFFIGALSATAGGAGFLVSGVLLSLGLTGEPYVATSAAIALSVHAGRIVSYAATGMFSGEVLRHAAITTVAVVFGNALGGRARRLFEGEATRRIEYGTLVVCGVLAVLGIVH
jgi:uncharacterized membrane protein YfcA